LLAHLSQFELHETPDAAEVDAHHAVVILAGRIGRFREHILDARVIVSRIETSKDLDIFFTIAATWASSDTSQRMAIAWRPLAAISFAADCAASSFRSASATEAPALANAFAVARPNPEPAPVTRATLFSKDIFTKVSIFMELAC
jgi:hypothetical protein